MAGTPAKIKQDFVDGSTVVQLVNTLNALIDAFDTHTHGGVTVGAGTSGAPSAVSGALVKKVTHFK